MRLSKLPEGDGMFVLSRYRHPNGYVIERERRSWSERNGNQVGGGCPLFSWNVYEDRGGEAGNRLNDFARLSEARAWCDSRGRREEASV